MKVDPKAFQKRYEDTQAISEELGIPMETPEETAEVWSAFSKLTPEEERALSARHLETLLAYQRLLDSEKQPGS
jgi:hypothetical protein